MITNLLVSQSIKVNAIIIVNVVNTIIINFVITTTIIGHLAPKCSLGILFRTSRFCIFPSIPRRSVSSDHREDNDGRDHHDDNDDHDHHDDEDYDESVPYITCRPMMIVKTIVMITNHS